eukprot:4924413-Pleurochrysis_carterae.AAC.2
MSGNEKPRVLPDRRTGTTLTTFIATSLASAMMTVNSNCSPSMYLPSPVCAQGLRSGRRIQSAVQQDNIIVHQLRLM